MDAATMANTPAMKPPGSVTPDFNSGSHLQTIIIAVYSATFVVATVFLCLRAYTSMVIVRRFDFDEPIIFLAWACSLLFFVFMILSMPAGFGKHLWNVSVVQLQGYLNLLLALAITYIWPPSLTKLALLVLYHRINPSKSFHLCIYALAIAIFGYTITFTVLFAGPCNPLTSDGICLNRIAIAQAVLNITSDALIIVLPIPMIIKLQMPRRQKMLASMILALGSGATVASIGRVSYVKQMQGNPDVTWTQASAAVWSCVELNLGIICNSLALLKPFVRKHMPWLIKSTRSGDASSSGPGSKFSGWRGDHASHSYQLHSVDKSRDRGRSVDNGGVRMQNEYRVQYSKKAENDASSTEIILPADSHDGV